MSIAPLNVLFIAGVNLSDYIAPVVRLRKGMERSASILTLTFGTTRMAELSALHAGHSLLPKKIPWYAYLLEVKWTSRPLNAGRRNRTLENFRVYWESNLESPVTWHSAATDHTQAHTISDRKINMYEALVKHRLRWSRGSVLAFSTQVCGFKPGQSRRIFRAKKSSACLPSEGK